MQRFTINCKEAFMAYYIGIDVGGSNIACAVVNEECEIISRSKAKTHGKSGISDYSEVLDVIKRTVISACESAGIAPENASSIGIGCPGICNSELGIVEYTNNLGFRNVPLKTDIEKEFNIPVYLDNDANAAAFGEFIAGAAIGSRNTVVITLGTGVGSGIIIDGKIYRGTYFAAGEIGHTVIVADGLPCSCGRKGCFEAYSSATGLVNMTKKAAAEHPESALNRLIKEDGRVSARTAYNAAKLGDEVGKAVTEQYVKYLSVGVANVINTFQPDVLCIGGGVCNEGSLLLNPLREAVYREIYSRDSKKTTRLAICTLGNDAGIIGAAMLHKAQ